MNPKFSFSRLALAIALYLCLVSPAIAQGTTGDIVGRVVDSTGEPGVGKPVPSESGYEFGSLLAASLIVRARFWSASG